MKIGQEATLRIVLLEMNFGATTYWLWCPAWSSRNEPEMRLLSFYSQILLSVKGYFPKLKLVFNQAKFDSIVLMLYHYGNTT